MGAPPSGSLMRMPQAVVSPSGFLLFPRQTTLFAQAFDFKKQELSGNPFPVAEQVAFDAALFCCRIFRNIGHCGLPDAARQALPAN